MEDIELKKIIIKNMKHHLDEYNREDISEEMKIFHDKLYEQYETMLAINRLICRLKSDKTKEKKQ